LPAARIITKGFPDYSCRASICHRWSTRPDYWISERSALGSQVEGGPYPAEIRRHDQQAFDHGLLVQALQLVGAGIGIRDSRCRTVSSRGMECPVMDGARSEPATNSCRETASSAPLALRYSLFMNSIHQEQISFSSDKPLHKEFHMATGRGWQRPAIHFLRQGLDGQRGPGPGIYFHHGTLALYRLSERLVIGHHAYIL